MAILLAVGPPLAAVDPSFGAQGLTALRVEGVDVLKAGQPHLQTAVFEQTMLDGTGVKTYTFERVTEAGTPSFRAAAKTSREEFSWGSVEVAYRPAQDRLDLVVTIANASARTLADFELTLGTLEFPAEPAGWKGGKGLAAVSLDNMALVKVEAGPVRLLVCNATTDPPFALGFGKAEKGKTAYPLFARGGVAAAEPGAFTLEPHGRPRVPAGKSLTLEVTIRRLPPGGQTADILADVYEKFRSAHGPALAWTDRRPIASIIHASAAKQHQSKTNPRGWLSNPKLDVITPVGKVAFREEMLNAAARAVQVIKGTGGQGMIFWDVEGQEHPHPISFIGDPAMAKDLAPEMDEVADAYFKVYRDAGLRTGVTLRPSQVYFNAKTKKWDHGTGSDGGDGRGDFYPALRPKGVPWYKFYPVVERLSDRIAYAKKRWGCTLFYVDTNGTHRQVGEDQKFSWLLLEAAVWQRLRELHPDVLIIPEVTKDAQSTHAAYWAYSAPYFEVDLKGYRTPASARDLFPGAFSVINVADGDLDKNREAIKAGVAAGDILLFRGWYSDKRNEWVKHVYADAKGSRK